MPTMAANLKDVLDEFKVHVTGLDRIVAAYATVELNPPKIHIWTLLDERDDATEDELARAEHKVLTSFPQIAFDFTTIHLRGRDPVQFLPEAAYPIRIRNEAVLKFFQKALMPA
jgi:hypothetical protein